MNKIIVKSKKVATDTLSCLQDTLFPARPKSMMFSRRNKFEFEDQMDYLQGIASTFDTRTDYGLIETIEFAVSNKYMGTVIIQMNEKNAQSFFDGCKYLLRCYRDQKKFFEMPLEKKPIFIDIFGSVVSYILEEDEQAFYAIDVGYQEDPSREIKETKAGQPFPRKMNFDFEEKIIGFKLGHMMIPRSGNIKAVLWSEKSLYIHAFNPDEEMEKEVKNVRKLADIEDSDSIKRILDFGVRQEIADDYAEDFPEFLLLEDEDGVIKIMKGRLYGQEFVPHKTYDSSQKDENEKIKNLKHMILIETYKLVGVFEKFQAEKQEDALVLQIFEIEDVKSEDDPRMSKQFEIVQNSENTITDLKSQFLCDHFNNCLYFRDMSQNGTTMIQYPIDNSKTNAKLDYIDLTTEVTLNIIAQNSKSSSYKPSGIIFQDFLSYENLCILLHGKVVSCFDLVDRERQPGHAVLQGEQLQRKDYYNFDNEPKAIWMADKPVKNISRRWKIIVAFRGGDIKELIFTTIDGVSSVTFEDYLKFPPIMRVASNQPVQPMKLPGTIEKIIRNRNNINQPVYFVIRRTGLDGKVKKVLATIEFQSGTYREFEFEGVQLEYATYIILEINDEKQFWQDIICIESIEDTKSQTLEQTLYYAKIRIGCKIFLMSIIYLEYELDAKSKEIVILNQETLQPDMENVQNASEIYVSGKFIYFVHRKSKGKRAHIDRYNFKNNSHQIVPTNASIKKFLAFDNKFFYWRTRNGGKNPQRHASNVYFDGVSNFASFQSASSNKHAVIQSGLYPHLSTLQYDSLSESIACFVDFTTFKVFPLLQNNSLKVKASINKDSKDDNFDGLILAINLFQNRYIVTLHQANVLSAWSLRTGKFLQPLEMNKQKYDMEGYVWQQRIDDTNTLIRCKNPIKEDDDDDDVIFFQNFPDGSNFTDKEIGIKMFKYRIVQLSLESPDVSDIENVKVNVVKSFIGPHIMGEIHQGVYAGDDLDVFTFLYNDGQDKMKMKYLKILDQTFEETEFESFYYMRQVHEADPDNSKLSIHSPNFKMLINKDSSKEYVVTSYDGIDSDTKLPKNLNESSSQIPNFLTNESILFQSKDKIIKSFNYKTSKEDFFYSNCAYPGVKESIDLATIFKTGPPNNLHVIGENSLTYYQIKSEQGTIKEYIAPNTLNRFLQNSYKKSESKPNQNEMKLIQNHYKSKVELDQRSIFGYYFKQVEVEENYFKQELHIVSTFSFYHWRILSLINKKKFDLSTLSAEDMQALLYCQLSNGTTLLHAIYKDKVHLENIISKSQSQQIEEQNFYVPLFRDQNDQTALDFCLNMKQTKPEQEEEGLEENPTLLKTLELLGKDASETLKQVIESDTIYRKSADYILSTISAYPFDLFKIDIQKLIPRIIKEELIGFQIYMENCTKTPIFMNSIDRAKIKVDESCGAVVYEMDEIWTKEDDQTQKKMFENGSVEMLVELQVVDVPAIHHSMEILEALSKSNNSNLFEIQSVKALIEQKWDLTIRNVVYKLLIPYALFLFVFMFYTIMDYETSYADQQSDVNPTVNVSTFYEGSYLLEGQKVKAQTIVLRILIVCFTIYFFYIEAKQMMDGFWRHITDYQNYIDLFPILLIALAEIMNLFSMDHRTIRTLYSITALVVWLRFIYFFRIVKSTNFYMKMIVAVIFDFSQFFFVFFISIFAFGHAIYIFSLNYNGLQDSTGSYVTFDTSFISVVLEQYLVPFGEYQQDNYDLYLPGVSWFYFILQSLIIIIVLLNLLISIVGDTFNRVNEQKSSIMYKDMVDLIVENHFLISPQAQETMNKGKYLVLVIPEDSVLDEQEQMQSNFDKIRGQIKEYVQQRELQTQKTHYKIDRNLVSQKEIKNDIKNLSKLVSQMAQEVKDIKEKKI